MIKYREDYPRPQFVRESFQNLNGEWEFSFDDDDIGIKNGWKNGFEKQYNIVVPYSYETELSGISDKSMHTVVWYQKKVEFVREKGKSVYLYFEGCDYETTVFVNGQYVGGHKGAYGRFGFDITDALADKENLVVVRACDSFDTETPRGKQRWEDESYGCWYVQTTGIWKTVWAETVSTSHVSHVKITPDFDSRSVYMDYTINNAAGSHGLRLETTISFKGNIIVSDTAAVCGQSFSRVYNLSSKEMTWDVADWSPNAPNLYDVSYRLYKGESIIDDVQSYFGLRKISIENGSVCLNNIPLYQKLVLDQGYWPESGITPPDGDAIKKDIDLTLAMGFNGVRKHQKIEDERYLYWCDVKGLLVWSEMAATYKFSDNATEQFITQWQEIIRQNYNHPSIIVWVPFNESWGVPNIFDHHNQQLFTEAIYKLTKVYDTNRPVICNDGWEHTVSDIITLHDYDSSGERLFERYGTNIASILNNNTPNKNSKHFFAKGYKYEGQPVIISEYGGVAYTDTDGWGYNEKAKSADEFIARTDNLTSAIRNMPGVSGYCITQLTDVEQEVNGLLYANREPKADIDKIHKIFSKS